MSRERPRRDPPIDPVVEPTSPVVPEHDHKPPQGVTRVLMLTVLLLVMVLGLGGWLQYDTNRRLMALEQYVADAKVKRDAQNQQVNDRIDQGVCRILDHLPAGPLWDPLREQYSCGPGIPPDEYPAASKAATPSEFYQSFPATRDDN